MNFPNLKDRKEYLEVQMHCICLVILFVGQSVLLYLKCKFLLQLSCLHFEYGTSNLACYLLVHLDIFPH